MADPVRSIAVRATLAVMGAEYGTAFARYETPLGYARLYKWVPGDTTTVDALTVIAGSGGTTGRWILVRVDDKGANLTDAAADITVAGDFLRVLPVSTLTANRILTMKVTAAAAGDVIRIVRLDVESYTLTINNDGPGAGTLFVLPSAEAWYAEVRFDGTNWEAYGCGQFP